MHKTGSTSVQHFFSRNRWISPFFGILYPRSSGPDGRRQPKHNAIFTAVSHEADFGEPHPVLGPSAKLISAVAARFRASSASVCILSAEGFSGEKPDFAAALAPLGAEFDVTVVVFLRRPDIWLERFHRQMILSREVRETRGIEVFAEAEDTRRHLDYFAVLDWWAAAFGQAALRILPYPEGDHDSLRAFFEAAELPRRFLAAAASRRRLNRSADTAAILRALAGNRSGGEASRTDLSLSDEARRKLASRLKSAWSHRRDRFTDGVQAPPFIFSMLEEIEASID